MPSYHLNLLFQIYTLVWKKTNLNFFYVQLFGILGMLSAHLNWPSHGWTYPSPSVFLHRTFSIPLIILVAFWICFNFYEYLKWCAQNCTSSLSSTCAKLNTMELLFAVIQKLYSCWCSLKLHYTSFSTISHSWLIFNLQLSILSSTFLHVPCQIVSVQYLCR